jgi:hypothetical protein
VIPSVSVARVAQPAVSAAAAPLAGTVTTAAAANAAAAQTAAAAAAPPRTISVAGSAGGKLLQVVGSGANDPSQTQLAPVTVQAGMSASVPREALNGTGIAGIEIGTAFPQQNLGSETEFAAAAGAVVNLMNRAKPAFAAYDLATATAGVTFRDGIYYVLSLTGTSLTVRGSDESSASSVLSASSAPDPGHTFVGAMVYSSTTASVRMYPKLQLSLPAPAVGISPIATARIPIKRLKYAICLRNGETTSRPVCVR